MSLPTSASPPITVVIATRLREDRLGSFTAMRASLTRQTVPWQAVIALTRVRTPYVNWADDDDEFTDDAMAVRLAALEDRKSVV